MDPSEIVRPLIVLLDALIVAVASWLLVCASGHGARGTLEAALAWGWCAVAAIAGAGVILGEVGGFGPWGFLALHSAVLAGVTLWRRTRLRDDWQRLRRFTSQSRELLNQPGLERMLALGLFMVLASLTAVAALAEPVLLDAFSYHLPRMAHWLQEKRIGILAASDVRLNIVAVLPDVVAAWLLSATEDGFRLVILPQAFGGIMAVGATLGLARCAGLTRTGAWIAGWLLLTMANVVQQFTAPQTDLFTTGLFATAFYLWIVALQAGTVSVPALLGAGLALGSKGTVFYLAPGALIWVAWLAWRHPLSRAQWVQTLLLAAVGVLCFAGPGLLRSWRAYGGMLGPEEMVRRHHRDLGSAQELAAKLRLNLSAALAQNLASASQPHGLRAVSGRVGLALASTLPSQDDFALQNLKRRETLQGILSQEVPDADTVAFGVVALLLFAAGTLVAWLRRAEGSTVVRVWSAGVLVTFGFFHVMHQWHPYAFRYLALLGPWIAVVGAWGVEQLRPSWRTVGRVLLLAAALDVAWIVTTQTRNAGWQTVVNPGRGFDSLLTHQWGEWADRLDASDEPLVLALPEERPLAAFYRREHPRKIKLVEDDGSIPSAEEWVRKEAGWLIVPANRFIGSEGRVMGRTWLLNGDEKAGGSVAAYRALRAGELPVPMMYRNIRRRGRGELQHELLIKTWSADPVRLTLTNPSSSECDYIVLGPGGPAGGVLPAGATTEVKVLLAPQVAQGFRVVFRSPTIDVGGNVPQVSLATP